MKRMLFLLFTLLMSTATFAVPSHDLSMKIKFDSAADGAFYDKAISMHKTIRIQPELNKNTIIMSQTTLKDNQPVTLALMVTPTYIKKDVITLQFNLVTYGYRDHAGVVTQPRLTLKLGEQAGINTDLFSLSVLTHK